MTAQLEERYVVLKISDIEKYLGDEGINALEDMCYTINKGRAEDNKQPFQAICVESDWPEYDPTWNLIKTRVEKEESKND